MLGVTIVGEAIMDVVRTTQGDASHPGGSPLNVAVGLGRLGVDVELLTRLGRDPLGDAILAHAIEAGVSVHEASLVAGATSRSIAELDESGGARYEFDFDWRLPGDPAVHYRDILHVGSISSFVEPGASDVEALIDRAPAGTIITFDPNIRSALCGPHSTAVERFERIASHADVVKLSDEDAAWLYPGASVDSVVGSIHGLGVQLAVVTLGAGGSVIATALERAAIEAVRVDVIDTIGAGDSYMAGLLFQLAMHGMPTADGLSATADFAARCAAITVSREGANPPWVDEVEIVQGDRRRRNPCPDQRCRP